MKLFLSIRFQDTLKNITNQNRIKKNFKNLRNIIYLIIDFNYDNKFAKFKKNIYRNIF